MFVAINVAAITLALYSAQLVPAGDARIPAAAQNAARADDATQQRPAVDDGEIVSVYEMLRSMPHSERIGAFREMPSATKAALWRHHLTQMEAEHPELSPEQRRIIKDFRSLFTPDLYDLLPSDPRYKSVIESPMEDIRRRAAAAFPRDLLIAVFLDM